MRVVRAVEGLEMGRFVPVRDVDQWKAALSRRTDKNGDNPYDIAVREGHMHLLPPLQEAMDKILAAQAEAQARRDAEAAAKKAQEEVEATVPDA